jgi:hypothetical protein
VSQLGRVGLLKLATERERGEGKKEENIFLRKPKEENEKDEGVLDGMKIVFDQVNVFDLNILMTTKKNIVLSAFGLP